MNNFLDAGEYLRVFFFYAAEFTIMNEDLWIVEGDNGCPFFAPSVAISFITQNFEGWVRQKDAKKFKDYAKQRYWKKEFEEII